MSAAAANSTESAPRIVGRPFKKGQSGNPSGRPKGVAAQARELVDNDPTRLLKVLLELAESTTAKDSDRKAAAAEFRDRGWGKAPSFAPVEDGDPLELSETERVISDVLDELAPRREAASAREAAGS